VVAGAFSAGFRGLKTRHAPVEGSAFVGRQSWSGGFRAARPLYPRLVQGQRFGPIEAVDIAA
jgi:hypothetical protein